MIRKWERARTRLAIDLQRRLVACPFHPRAEVRYLWEIDDVVDPDGWCVAGFYWRPEPAAAWTLLGCDVSQARRYVRGIERAQGLRKGPPTADEFLEGLGVVLSVAGLVLPVAADAVNLGKAIGGKQ
jgi:hypothetical protein